MMKNTALAASLGCLLAATAASATPNDRRPVVLVVDDSAAQVVPADSVRRAVTSQIAAPAVAPASTPLLETRGTLTLSLDADGRIVLLYRDSAGNEIHRTVVIPTDPNAAAETVSLVAANIIRNEATELLAALAPPPGPAPEVPPALPQPYAIPRATLVMPRTTTRTYANRALRHRVYLSLEGLVSHTEGSWAGGGGSIGVTVSKHFAVGINSLNGYSHKDSGKDVFGVGWGPFGEVFWFPLPWLQIYGQFGVPMQVHWTGGTASTSTSGKTDNFGAAPYAGTGIRFWMGNRFSIGLSLRSAVVITPQYLAGNALLDRGSVYFAGGLDFGVHL